MEHHTVILNPGKEKPVLNGHPWIFSGAVKSAPKDCRPGDLCDVLDSKKQFVARGYYNPKSQICVRVLTKDLKQMIDSAFIKQRIFESVKRRESYLHANQTCARLVSHESDLLPGLIVDKYGDWISFQIVTAGMERWRSTIIDSLKESLAPKGIYERSDDDVRIKEGLEKRKETVYGSVPDTRVQVLENGMKLFIDIVNGHKTGFYLDQKDNRHAIREFAKDRVVLNCFSYTGGFAVSSLFGGATHVDNVDESEPALEIMKENIVANGFDSNKSAAIRADVFSYLRSDDVSQKQYDLIVLDPPKFVTSSAQVDKACRGYKDLNRLAMKLLKPGGILATFSCSGLISRELFQKVVFSACVEAQSEMQIIKHLSQSEDHPTLLTFPESLYLKGFLLRKIL